MFVAAHIVCGGLVLGLYSVHSTLCPFYFCNNLAGEERISSLLLLCSGCHVAVVVL